jgi:hypothetical protein
MIRSREGSGSSPSGFGALALMRSLEQQLAAKQGKPSDEAQQLFYEAMEAATDGDEFELLQEALKLDPGNTRSASGTRRLPGAGCWSDC